MGYRTTLTLIFSVALTITGCYTEEEPLDENPESIVDVAPQYQRICENHLQSLQGLTPPAYVFTMRRAQSSDAVLLENGDFESLDGVPDGFVRNTDPAYVYSGEGSVQITDSRFRAHIREEEHFSSRDLVSLTFWIYSANDEAIDYYIYAHGMMLDRINGPDGFGYSGHSQMSQKTIAIEPHRWIEVKLDFETYHECLSELTVRTSANDAVFYIDDIEIQAALTEVE